MARPGAARRASLEGRLGAPGFGRQAFLPGGWIGTQRPLRRRLRSLRVARVPSWPCAVFVGGTQRPPMAARLRALRVARVLSWPCAVFMGRLNRCPSILILRAGVVSMLTEHWRPIASCSRRSVKGEVCRGAFPRISRRRRILSGRGRFDADRSLRASSRPTCATDPARIHPQRLPKSRKKSRPLGRPHHLAKQMVTVTLVLFRLPAGRG